MIDRSATNLESDAMAFVAFAGRPLDLCDVEEARQVASEAGVHGAYVRNALDTDLADSEDQIYGLYGADGLLGIAYFGGRGNLIVIERIPLEPQRVADLISACPWEWRIVLARREIVQRLCRADRRTPLVNRRQIYYGVAPSEVSTELVSNRCRFAERKDAKPLMAAALDLNESDLNVARWRVNRAWLRDTVRRRIKNEQTLVLGEVGAPECKLDVGSCGSAAAIVEGVYTLPAHRGRGLAAELVATVAREHLADYPLVCLHVSEENKAARRAYERAGMLELGACWLMLRG